MNDDHPLNDYPEPIVSSLRAWGWRIDWFRLGGFVEITPGDTIMVMLWLGWWAVRAGWDWGYKTDSCPEGTEPNG